MVLISLIFQRNLNIGTTAFLATLCHVVCARSGRAPIALRIGTTVRPGCKPFE